ncbi:MAG: hypothetical protein IJM15_06435 [Erysipelotrichaceae bacterium]|nr:hypothetical protein [Erysipelotrichaceae bacterium]
MIRLPKDVIFILQTLHDNSCSAFAVGGCIRDHLLGAEPKDYDITTDASAQRVKEIFSDHHTIDTGLKHGTVTLRLNRQNYEITTFRTDGEYLDHRHPESVSFSSSIEDDLSRRDFTINAMAYSPYEGLIDLHNGQSDLKNGIVRTVGDPLKRFDEDALRILRALRFASRYSFKIEENTSKAIHQKKDLLKHISGERILAELKEILVSDDIDNYLNEYRDVFEVFMPDLGELHPLDDHLSDFSLRLAVLFTDYSDRQISRTLNSLHCEKKLLNLVRLLHQYQNKPIVNADIYLKKRILPYLDEHQFDLLADLQQISDPKLIEKVHSLYRKGGYLISDLAIDGSDLVSLGYSGKQIGSMLEKLLSAVVENRLQNERETLMGYCKRAQNMVQDN